MNSGETVTARQQAILTSQRSTMSSLKPTIDGQLGVAAESRIQQQHYAMPSKTMKRVPQQRQTISTPIDDG
ncbi:unnamed protein product, partial [Rotaria sp. Silwood1]